MALIALLLPTPVLPTKDILWDFGVTLERSDMSALHIRSRPLGKWDPSKRSVRPFMVSFIRPHIW
ncbi:hypothetical protein SERLA73DRAFT_183021 [Serpula lacrymans var. lacrymans S7.3]|uniref:Uncharacterized protein n=1 Tax=Serpula lacrymans var. lacrymans (strain S7.3) TaxID=936435 RepID=F8Q1G0_SERL3|nr:hypothetical protein SERLA73DRAFT_183021 [Serpula lacrymans var. lacrymans S7.3]